MLAERGFYQGKEAGLVGVAGDLQALELAIEPDVDVQGTSILVEVQEGAAASRERAALTLSKLRQLAQPRKQRL